MPTITTQIINLSFHMTTAVTPVDATGHAAIHNVSINAAHFRINQRHEETSTKTFPGATTL
jgi:hypothetical protein